jgi:hypothetical protein
MKKVFLFSLLTILVTASSVFADTKVKIRQTMSGQSYENTTYIKGKRERTEQNMGSMQMVTITQCDLKRSLQIMPVSQTYMVNSWDTTQTIPATTTTKTVTAPTTKGGVVTTTVTIKDTGERKKMFGFEARHLIISMNTESSPEACNKSKMKMETDGWYIDATFGIDCDMERAASFNTKNSTGGCQDKFEMKQNGAGKRGYPLYEKMTMFDENGKETFSTVSEVLEFSKATLEDALFDVPQGYREVKNAAEMYQTASISNSSSSSSSLGNTGSYTPPTNSGVSQNAQNLSKDINPPVIEVGKKKEGTIRIGLVSVKVNAAGEGMNPADLAAAIQNTLTDYLNGTKVELVQLDAKLPSAIAEEAKSRECDFVLYANVSHKKGSSGFGAFGKVLGQAVAQTGGGNWGNTTANIAGAVVAHAVVAATISQNVKAKDEISLDIKLQNGEAVAFTKQYKAKAKSDGEDILSPMLEQAAQAILDAVNR